jgi:hypothetical protein
VCNDELRGGRWAHTDYECIELAQIFMQRVHVCGEQVLPLQYLAAYPCVTGAIQGQHSASYRVNARSRV